MNEYQITTTPRHHQLTNINVWTPDSQWLVYDVRPQGSSFIGKTIEKIHVNTTEIREIYRGNRRGLCGCGDCQPAVAGAVCLYPRAAEPGSAVAV